MSQPLLLWPWLFLHLFPPRVSVSVILCRCGFLCDSPPACLYLSICVVSSPRSSFPPVPVYQTRWDTFLTGTQRPSPALPSCDLRPFPTARSGFSSFKRHINYSNEVRRDPPLCHPELGTHCMCPPGPAASCPSQLGRVGCPRQLPRPYAYQLPCPCAPTPPCGRRVIGGPRQG